MTLTGLQYKREEKPLLEAAEDLREDVEQGAFDLVIVDSFGLASGGDQNDAQTVLGVFNAIRRLNCTVLIIDHLGKGPDARERGAFGSSYKRHAARSMWELVQGDIDLQFGLFHRKANRGRLASPIGLRLDITENDNYEYLSAAFSPCDVGDIPDQKNTVSVPLQILQAIQDTSENRISRADLLKALPDVQSKHVDSKLTQLKQRGSLIDLGRGLYGLPLEDKPYA